ncbi:coiled-coil domain-containing protein [Gracilimonas tropica]|uniref:coiled-coil domain-containing protein n=1 Tax=Gracilimonas tropica TaxID=454600 RepID=UPI0003697BFC|nr:hypothetical protein [Gracilimonas tropica]
MRSLTKVTVIAFTLVLGGLNAFAQTSDYQVKKEFENTYSQLKTAVTMASSTAELDSLQSEISDLQENYDAKSSLLDDALYPQTFQGSIEELKQLARSSKSKVMVIEDQNERLASLSDELSSYKSEVNRLNSRTDSLMMAIRNSESSEKDLSALVQRYRESMEERDEFMLNMIDSLFMTYKDIQSDKFQEIANQEKQRILQESENPLQVLQSVINENIATLKSAGNSLQTEDYLRMYVVQNRFDEVWDQIGGDLVQMYGGDNKTQWKNNMENALSDWRASASKNMWSSLDAYLENNNVELSAFDNNESFYRAIENFVTNATKASRDKVLTEENYETFQVFHDIWNGKIKNDWGKFVQEGEVLTMSQISTIDNEMMTWKEHAQPRSFLIPILFGISLLTIVGLIIVLARR